MNSRISLATVICAILAWAANASAALGQNGPADYRLPGGNGEDPPPSFSETPAGQPRGAGCFDGDCGQSCFCPRWTASAGCIILARVGDGNQTLVTTYPVPAPPKQSQLIPGTGTERLNSSDFNEGVSGGASVDLIRHGDCGCDLEFSFFQTAGWSDTRSIPPNGTSPVFMAPGGFVQTTDNQIQNMAWGYSSNLCSAELNARWDLCPRVAMLAGFRWVSLREELQGVIVPADKNRKVPFWDISTWNNLCGFQVGEDWKLWDRGRFSLDGLVKAGIFGNDVEEATAVSIYRHVYSESASTGQAAFVGEIGLQCKYQVAKGLLLRAGYEAIWLQGFALAPGQIQETYMTSPTTAQALGVNCNSDVFYHGATAGLEYSF
jgi:hypothetical protein